MPAFTPHPQEVIYSLLNVSFSITFSDFQDIHAFSDVVFRTAFQQFTRFQEARLSERRVISAAPIAELFVQESMPTTQIDGLALLGLARCAQPVALMCH